MAWLSKKHRSAHVACLEMAIKARGVLLDSSVVIAFLREQLDLRGDVDPGEPLS